MKYFVGGDSSALSNDTVLTNAVFTFGEPRANPNPGGEHQVVDMSVQMDFDSSNTVNKWANEVAKQADEGCSSRKVWFPNPAWQIEPTGAWVGSFHVKQINRACYWFFGNQQTDLGTLEIDFWDRVAVAVSSDGKKIDPVASNGQSDNASPLLKALAQGLGALVQIVTLGFVPQAQVQAIDGHNAEEHALDFINQYEKGLLKDTSAAGAKDYSGFTFDFLFKKAVFRREGDRLILSVTSSQDVSNLPSNGEACTIRETLNEMKTGGKMVGPNGTNINVTDGDSLWNLANKYYGSSKYYLLIAAANNIPMGSMDHLDNHKNLRLDSIASLRDRKDFILVMRGDSLWRIATKRSGPAESFTRLEAANSTWLIEPAKIYPIQLIRRSQSAK